MARSSSSRIPIPNLGKPTEKEKKAAKKIASQAPKISSPGAQPTKKKQPAAPKTNPYSGMSNARIKAEYIKMSDADKKKFGMQMHKAAMANKKKGTSKPATTKPKPTKPKPTKPTASTTTPTRSAQANTGTGRDGKFGSGTFGKGRPSDGKPKPTKHTGGKRAKVNRKPGKDWAAGAREVSERARRMHPTPSSMPMSPAKNPKKGHRYKKPFGPVMVYNGTKYVPQ